MRYLVENARLFQLIYLRAPTTGSRDFGLPCAWVAAPQVDEATGGVLSNVELRNSWGRAAAPLRVLEDFVCWVRKLDDCLIGCLLPLVFASSTRFQMLAMRLCAWFILAAAAAAAAALDALPPFKFELLRDGGVVDDTRDA